MLSLRLLLRPRASRVHGSTAAASRCVVLPCTRRPPPHTQPLPAFGRPVPNAAAAAGGGWGRGPGRRGGCTVAVPPQIPRTPRSHYSAGTCTLSILTVHSPAAASGRPLRDKYKCGSERKQARGRDLARRPLGKLYSPLAHPRSSLVVHKGRPMKFLDSPRSGSIAGTTYSRNRFGQYARTRAIPVQPSTPQQLVMRARMSTNAAGWRALTDAQRAGWLSLGLQMTRTDSLGQTYDLNGFLAYCSVNNNNLDAGNAAVADAPAIVTPPTLLTATVTLTAAAFSIAYTATPLGAGQRLFTFASPQKSAGRKFNGDYRLIAVSAAAAVSPAVVLAAYTARLGVPVAGNRIFLSLAVYQAGFIGAPFGVSQIVV